MSDSGEMPLSLEDLADWVESACGGPIVRSVQASGGNRCIGWAIDIARADGVFPVFLRFQVFDDASGGPFTIRREAQLYEALQSSGVNLPRFVALHPQRQAMLTGCLRGRADYRALKDPVQKDGLARQCAAALAGLHRVDALALDLPGFGGHRTIHAAVRADREAWHAMYLASGRTDPLIEFGKAWLEANLPAHDGPPVVVHGDAGPGNFMFEDGRLTGLIDWELAHLGDPMEDIAWMSLRSVLEPVPRFASCVEAYEEAAGSPLDHARVLYHRVFVSWRICIIRHCNVSGRAGASVINRALNRRLLVEAIDACEGRSPAPGEPAGWTPGEHDGLFEQVLEDIRTGILPSCADAAGSDKAKDVAKAVKFMRALYNIGPDVARREAEGIARLLGEPCASLEAGRSALVRRIREGGLAHAACLDFFRLAAALQTRLAAGPMGQLADRHYPALDDRGTA